MVIMTLERRREPYEPYAFRFHSVSGDSSRDVSASEHKRASSEWIRFSF